jgi:hypothetical protein
LFCAAVHPESKELHIGTVTATIVVQIDEHSEYALTVVSH